MQATAALLNNLAVTTDNDSAGTQEFPFNKTLAFSGNVKSGSLGSSLEITNEAQTKHIAVKK